METAGFLPKILRPQTVEVLAGCALESLMEALSQGICHISGKGPMAI